MAADVLGNPLGVQASRYVAALDDFILGLLGYDRRVLQIFEAAGRAEDCLTNAYAALAWLSAETGDVPPEAERYIRRAQTYAADASPRERAVLDVARHWAAGDVAASEHAAGSILAAHPRDLVMLKLLHYHQFNRGDFSAMLRVALECSDAAADIPYLHGMLAFAYEQCHLIGDAERSARRALAMLPGEPWAQHALAHALLTTGRIAEGTAFLEAASSGWNGLISFMYTHLWWHLALFYLSRGRNAEALAIYDERCWSQQRENAQDQIGAVSLLARLEFAGIDVGERWTDVGTYLAARAADVVTPFLSLQYLYGLLRARRPEAHRLLAAIRRAPFDGPAVSRAVWADVGVDVAEGLVAYAAGDDETALRRLEPALGRLIGVGGSHVQRDLFDQIVLAALLRSGRLSQSQQVLEMRRDADPGNVPVNRLLTQVHERVARASGDPADRADHHPAAKAPASY